MRTFIVVLQKEFRQFFKSAFLPKLCVMFPIMVMLIMPLVANMEVKNVGVVIVDQDHSPLSQKIISSVQASEYLELYAMATDFNEAIGMVESGNADAILEIPSGYYADLLRGYLKPLNISANSVNATKGSMGGAYLQATIAPQIIEVSPKLSKAIGNAIRVTPMYLFNPTLNYRYFMIPALMIMLIVMLCGFLPALNIVGEKEKGTIEQINVSPIKPLTFTFGKIVPYWIIGLVILSLAMLIAWAVYGLVPRGGILTIYLASGLFIIVMSSMAVLFANFSDNMQQVMFIMFFFVMVFILMSGLMTPIQSMPAWAQNVTYLIPPRYFVEIMRATYLKGADMIEQSFSFLMLSLYALLFVILAMVTYKKQN